MIQNQFTTSHAATTVTVASQQQKHSNILSSAMTPPPQQQLVQHYQQRQQPYSQSQQTRSLRFVQTSSSNVKRGSNILPITMFAMPLLRRSERQFSHYLTIQVILVLFMVVIQQHSVVRFGVHAGWIDIDTPLEKRTTISKVDGTVYHLVMSDEFNVDGRTFKDGHDPLWTALDKSDDDASEAGGGSLQFYNSSAITTENGYLRIATILEKTNWNRFDHIKKTWKHEQTNFTSGMIQSWEKFCFTGGIIEVDVIFPGDPYIGGLWPAIWMLGNLGRATYEASTNNIWPWSYNECNRELQDAQTISACNAQNHFGMHPFQGRGATEIDLVEVMTGYSKSVLPSTHPPLNFPYGDMTLQVAPGVSKNRPQTGAAPLSRTIISASGHTEFLAQTWYKGLEMHGNTSINPFFYGTYLAETKPNEPVTRTKNQAFQADAVGVAHQLHPKHFEKPHTFRLEWQPGRGGRIDWYIRDKASTSNMTDDNDAFTHILGLKDASLKDLMGSQIPMEPMAIIFNTAVSSTWGFPYDSPDWCPKCYDCDDPKCACAFYPGFCQMIRSNRTAMYIDYVRVYQSSNPDAHVGAHHTLGCDPPNYPTKEWIHGHSYRYMRNPPFSYEDKHPLRPVQRGGGPCTTDDDCGGNVKNLNYTAIFEQQQQVVNNIEGRTLKQDDHETIGRGQCVSRMQRGMFSMTTEIGNVCSCYDGYTGPYCMSLDHIDDSPSAYKISTGASPFRRMHYFVIPNVMLMMGVTLVALLWILLLVRIRDQKMERINSTSKAITNPTIHITGPPVGGNGPILHNNNANTGYSSIR